MVGVWGVGVKHADSASVPALLKGCSLTVRSVDTPGEEPKWTNEEASTSEAFLLLVIVTQEGASRP